MAGSTYLCTRKIKYYFAYKNSDVRERKVHWLTTARGSTSCGQSSPLNSSWQSITWAGCRLPSEKNDWHRKLSSGKLRCHGVQGGETVSSNTIQMYSEKLSSIHELLHKHERVIRSLISRRSGPEVLRRMTVDDLYQETIAEACGSTSEFEFQGDAPFVQWIGTIARRVITRSLRDLDRKRQTMRIRRSGSSGVGVPEAFLLARDRTPSSIVARGDNRVAVARGMMQLPDHYRRVLTLKFIEQRPLEEVAASMNRTKGATCRLLCRALRSLRMVLNGAFLAEEYQDRTTESAEEDGLPTPEGDDV